MLKLLSADLRLKQMLGSRTYFQISQDRQERTFISVGERNRKYIALKHFENFMCKCLNYFETY